MSTVTYQPNTDPHIERRVRQRYDKEMAALREFGFEPWFVLEELLFPFSLFLCIIILPLMIFYRQVFRIKYPLRMVMYDQAVNHPSLGTIAFLGGLGVKFYTQFTDGGLLMSGISVPTAVETDTFWFYPAPRGADLAAAWRFHQDKVAVHLALGSRFSRSSRLKIFSRSNNVPQQVSPNHRSIHLKTSRRQPKQHNIYTWLWPSSVLLGW
jgi:hypothetical protein